MPPRVEAPDVSYARSGDVSLAYVVTGTGSIDLVFVHGFVGNPRHRVGAAVARRVLRAPRVVCARHRVPGARRVEIAGEDIVFFIAPGIAEEVQRFVTSVWGEAEPETVLSTVLFTDIVDSTQRAAEVGDRQWAELVGSHHALVRRQLDRFRGRELDTAGDGFFASFDGPARAIRCARAISESVRKLGLEVRAGLHTGECEVIGEKLGGIAVNIGARVAARAQPGEVGIVELKGVPGSWQLYAVA